MAVYKRRKHKESNSVLSSFLREPRQGLYNSILQEFAPTLDIDWVIIYADKFQNNAKLLYNWNAFTVLYLKTENSKLKTSYINWKLFLYVVVWTNLFPKEVED